MRVVGCEAIMVMLFFCVFGFIAAIGACLCGGGRPVRAASGKTQRCPSQKVRQLCPSAHDEDDHDMNNHTS